jgi:hypothetical protein
MKTQKLFFLILFVSISIASFSQEWNRVFDETRFSIVHGAIATTDNGVVVCSNTEPYQCFSPKLFKYDSIGNLQWQTLAYGIGADAICNSKDGNFLTVGFSWNDYDVGTDEYLILSKIKNNGDYIFKDSILIFPQWNYTTLYFYPKGILEFESGNILIYSENRILKTDSIGNIIFDKTIEKIDSIKKVQIISENQFLISTAEKLYKIDETGAKLDSITIDNSDFVIKNNNIVVAFQNKITFMEMNFAIIDFMDFSANFSSISQFFKQGDNYYLKGISVDNIFSQIVKLSNNFQLLLSHTFQNEKIDKEAFYCTNGSHQYLVFEKLEQCAILHNSKDINIVLDELPFDISPENLRIDNIKPDIYVDYQGVSHQVGFWFDAHVTIRNNGAYSINNLALYSKLHGFMNCYDNFIYSNFSSLNIQSGQTIDLDLFNLYEMSGYSPFTFEFCITALAPNSEIETDISNNEICGDFLISGIEENIASELNLKLYPNPFSNKINLYFEENESFVDIEICDLSGKKVISQTISSKLQNIDVSSLKSGVYFAKIKTKNQTKTQKLIKI